MTDVFSLYISVFRARFAFFILGGSDKGHRGVIAALSSDMLTDLLEGIFQTLGFVTGRVVSEKTNTTSFCEGHTDPAVFICRANSLPTPPRPPLTPPRPVPSKTHRSEEDSFSPCHYVLVLTLRRWSSHREPD